MARDLMEDENNYYKSSGGIIPVKWTAPEVKRFTQFTHMVVSVWQQWPHVVIYYIALSNYIQLQF